MFCQQCGMRNPEESKFCQSCGSEMTPRGHHARNPREHEAARVVPLRRFEASNLLFMKPVLEFVSRGEFLRRFVAGYLRVSAVLTALGGLVLIVTLLVQAFGMASGVGDVLAVLLALLIGLAAVYIHAHLFWLRADSVSHLGESSYIALPITSVIIRLAGEQVAVLSVVGGVTGLVAALFATSYVPMLYPFGAYSQPALPIGLIGGGALVAGLLSLLSGVIFAFIALLIAYFLAESLVVLVDIADNTKVRSGQDMAAAQG